MNHDVRRIAHRLPRVLRSPLFCLSRVRAREVTQRLIGVMNCPMLSRSNPVPLAVPAPVPLSRPPFVTARSVPPSL